MRFVILYRNRSDVRTNVEQIIKQLIAQGANLAIQAVQHPVFVSRPYWPSAAEINGLPLTAQCEEVEWKEGQLVTLRQLVIDVQVTTIQEPCSPSSSEPSPVSAS